MDFLLEIIGFNIESCVSAQANGADRIELCDSPPEGGTTPSYAFIKEARKKLHIPLYVMIRPRGGNFLYSDEEYSMMRQDIIQCKKAGCDGVVFGILNPDGSVNKEQCTRLVEAAYPMGVTFHRAFDRVNDPEKALKDVMAAGCERILTSGLRPKVEEGLDMITKLVQLAVDDIIIMPGSGVNSSNIRKIIESTGVREIHSSASTNAAQTMQYQNPLMNENLTYVVVNEAEVRQMSSTLKGM